MSDIFTFLSFENDSYTPTIWQGDKKFQPRNRGFTLKFDTSQRFCTGWHELSSSKNFPCPENAMTEKKYSVCPACQRKTGFNPAFYHAKSVSPQQDARNLEPHFLYLAHFGTGYVKVGMSWAARDLRRLLDQGARSAIILKTYPSANIARQYEAAIAALPGFHENTKTRTKIELLQQPYNQPGAKDELLAACDRIRELLGITHPETEVRCLDTYYLGSNILQPRSLMPLTDSTISGHYIGMIGDLLITTQQENQLLLPLRQFYGYPMIITDQTELIELAPRQMNLF